MKIGMLFPGYGSQVVGMGKDIYDESRVMQEYFEEAFNCLDKNFIKLCFASSDTELGRMENAYTSLFLVSASLAAVLKEHEIIPHVVAGYDLGQYAAIHAVGGFSLPDGLYLLAKYASLYQSLLETMPSSGIIVSGISAEQAQELCRSASSSDARASIAFNNTPFEHVIMGDKIVIDSLRSSLLAFPDVKVFDAPVELGLHSSLMDPVVANYRMYLEKVDFKELAAPLMSNVDSKEIVQSDDVKTAVIKQIHSPILWSEVMEALIECDLIIEVGPGNRLSTLMKAVYPEKQCVTFNKMSDIAEIKQILEEQIVVEPTEK